MYTLYSLLFKYYITVRIYQCSDVHVHLWNCWERIVCNTFNSVTKVRVEVAHIVVLRVSTGAFCLRKIFSIHWPIGPDSPPRDYNTRHASTEGITYVSCAWLLVLRERMSVKVCYEYPSFLSSSNILQIDGKISIPFLKGFEARFGASTICSLLGLFGSANIHPPLSL